MLIGVLVALGASCSRGDGSVAGETLVPRTLDVEATVSESGIRVTNQNGFDWADCNVQLNTEPGGDLSPWGHPTLVGLDAGQTTMLAFADFSHHDLGQFDREQFESLTYRLLLLTCQTPEGMGFGDAQIPE